MKLKLTEIQKILVKSLKWRSAMSAEVTVEEVTEALKDVYDPEIPVNVVDLGLIYGVQVDDDSNVHVDMTLTAAGCGMGPFIAQQAEWAIADLDGV